MNSDLGNKTIMAANIRHYLRERNMKRGDLCDALGFKYSTVTAWLNAEKYPRIDKIEMMANYFRISKADLVEKRSCENTDKFLLHDEHELEHIEKYRAISDEHREAVDVQLDFFYKKDTENFVKKESPSSGLGESDAG